MYGIADCNSFFVNCERVFRPDLQNKPVVVLSNNDGIVVALSSEAKAAGIHRGDPIFKVSEIVDKYKVTVFSSNYVLYADMSNRVLSTLREIVPEPEPYSIDESFFNLTGIKNHNEMCLTARKAILKNTGIPVSIGIAQTKTLAKCASKFAKQFAGYNGVCAIDTESKRVKALEMFNIEDVWGIGYASASKLKCININNALKFTEMPDIYVNRMLHKPGLNTKHELQGIDCIDCSELPKKSSITTSRSFEKRISDFDELKVHVCTFASRCAAKLRSQKSAAGIVSVFIMSDVFRDDLPQYVNSSSVVLNVAASSDTEITKAAIEVLKKLYRSGIGYKRCGVTLMNICENLPLQTSLFNFDPQMRKKVDILSKTIDNINSRYGDFSVFNCEILSNLKESESVFTAGLRRQYLSPAYSVSINESIEVK